jgi:tetratricopeptide (TPR) repeat protein
MNISHLRLVPFVVAAAVLSPPSALARSQSSELRPDLAMTAGGRGGGVVSSSAAQTAVPSHKHYDTPVEAPPTAPGAPLAPRLQNLGVHTFKVSTADPRAQLFINQGLNLTYGFNHAEAGRAFAEAARLDPNLAMAYWGQALVLGPNINAAMDAEAEPRALALIQKAMALRDRAPARERAYIEALSARYTGKPDDRSAADRAYASAMKQLTAAFPDDLDARTLYAESLMDLRPWGYWTRDGRPYDETREIESTLAAVIAKHDTHPGALHLWVHLWESVDPKRAEAEADRLVPLMPGAGHMVHMPAHIYQRIGRHADVIRVNQMAARADEDYIAQCRAQGLYPLAYYPHNLHFIWMGASASGQKTLAMESARKLAGAVPAEALKGAPILQGFLVVPYYAMVRFGEWDQILADPGPAHATAFTRGVYSYARAMALIARNRLDEAERALEELRELAVDPSIAGQTTFSSNTGRSILRIAPEVVAGELAAARRQWDSAVLHFDRAIRYEDALVYQEPPDWHVPVRQNLAAALIGADRASEAETVLWEDLKRNPDHVWNLSLLSKALTAQNKTADAAMIEARLARALKGAHAMATTSGRE